ncbi:uncharacterized protein LOC124187955 isoform X1 [Neodiprion fabricii]|uniref:uncharacterized protein LOC124187955 isoform X1 n=1 Tax=Neodiprion fabricii TaxID=2872261 RepID=UPI001ED9108F|nr:uncharacterized protein LOC124187955 isoform X1 [Neodiprion fabricii]XP_046436122.1 uncharacterized protein LOC124187955 isoform X1 [Neodiprion fabricii]XP_046436123.1 uncharacterized protein LOC124187955 isoform X1 [Neodiprion fabricii]
MDDYSRMRPHPRRITVRLESLVTERRGSPRDAAASGVRTTGVASALRLNSKPRSGPGGPTLFRVHGGLGTRLATRWAFGPRNLFNFGRIGRRCSSLCRKVEINRDQGADKTERRSFERTKCRAVTSWVNAAWRKATGFNKASRKAKETRNTGVRSQEEN